MYSLHFYTIRNSGITASVFLFQSVTNAAKKAVSTLHSLFYISLPITTCEQPV